MSLRPVKQIIQTQPTIEGGWRKAATRLWLRQNQGVSILSCCWTISATRIQRITKRVSLASAPAGSKRLPTCSPGRLSTATVSATRQNDRRRRAMDDCRQRHPPPGKCPRRSARPNAWFPAVWANLPSALKMTDPRYQIFLPARSRGHRRRRLPTSASSAASSGAKKGRWRGGRRSELSRYLGCPGPEKAAQSRDLRATHLLMCSRALAPSATLHIPVRF